MRSKFKKSSLKIIIILIEILKNQQKLGFLGTYIMNISFFTRVGSYDENQPISGLEIKMPTQPSSFS